MSLANIASEVENTAHLLKKPHLDALVVAIGTTMAHDSILLDHCTNLFHNIVKLDPGAGQLVIQSGFHERIVNRQLLACMSARSAISSFSRDLSCTHLAVQGLLYRCFRYIELYLRTKLL